jgi:hypothetical protein
VITRAWASVGVLERYAIGAVVSWLVWAGVALYVWWPAR